MDFWLFKSAPKDTATPNVISVNSKIRALAFLPDEKLCVVSGEEERVELRRLENNMMGEQIESSNGILAVSVSRDGRRIVTGTTNGFTIWSRMQGKETPDMVARHAVGGVRAIDISLDSRWVVTGSDSRTVDVWDITTGERHPTFEQLKHEYNVIAVKFCPCGNRIATATLFGSVRIYAINSRQKLLTIPISLNATLSAPNVPLTWFSHLPQIFAVSQGQIKCLKSDDGTLIVQWATRGVKHPASIALSPNHKVIAYSINNTVVLRDTTTHEQIGESKHDGNVSCIAFSPGNDHLVVGFDTKFSIWDLRKFLTETYFSHTTIESPKSCEHHEQDTMQKSLPSTFSLPLMSISNGAVKPWLHGFLADAEEVFSTEIKHSTSASPSDHNIFANRAIIRGRLKNGIKALEDAKTSLDIRPSAIGQIAKTFALISQEKYTSAREEIPKVLQIFHPEHGFLLEVIQGILLSESGEYTEGISRINELVGNGRDQKLLLLVQANMYLSEGRFDDAMNSFRQAQVPAVFPHEETLDMWTISFIFGWKFSGLAIQIQQQKSEFLLDGGSSEAADLFVQLRNIYRREIAMHVELSDWAIEFRKKCLEKLEGLGDGYLESGKYQEAVKQYTAIEPLIGDLDSKFALLLKRSEAHAKIPNWNQASRDAEDAIKLNPYSPWGYDRKHAVLYACRHYREAAEALDEVIRWLVDSKDSKSIGMRERGVTPHETKEVIVGAIDKVLSQPRPHLLINTESGRIYDKTRQGEAFRAHPQYRDLVLSPASQIRPNDVWEKVEKYFRYSTLSHTWEEEGEPEFREVESRSVESLPESFSNTKIKTFCKITSKHGYMWAWIDTCCINKAEKEALDLSLRSMFRWYSGSSLTIVHLKGVHQQIAADFDALLRLVGELLDELLKEFVECRWNKRAWTLQEYIASRVILFYTEDWKPYLPTEDHPSMTNHRASPPIQRGMELVTGLNMARLNALEPGSAEIRQKLRLASTREAKRKEDVAYSLLGIFDLTIETIYGDDEEPRALGRLLGALLTQSADVSILAWTGKPSKYNTCLPSEITVYRELESRYLPTPIEGATSTSALDLSNIESAILLHKRLLDALPPELHHGRLTLACILFRVSSVTLDQSSRVYTVTVPQLGEIKVKTEDNLSNMYNMCLVHPWCRRLLDPAIPLSDSQRRESASKLLASLRQPFGALLLALASGNYKRVAADSLIEVQIPESVSAKQLSENIHVLYIR